MADTCEALATTTLGSATSAISFSSISASYEHLLIVGDLKSTQGTAGSCEILVTLNTDTGSNYETQGMWGYQTTENTQESIGAANMIFMGAGTDTMNVNQHGVVRLLIADYANSNKSTTIRNLGGNIADGDTDTAKVVTVSGGLWNTTTAVNAVTLTSSSGNLKTNSTLTLLGLRSS